MLNTRDVKGLEAADRFVSAQQSAGNKVWWEGYRMVFFRPEDRAMTSKDGMFYDGQWGFRNVVEVDDNGVWKVDYRNVRRVRSTSGTRH